MSAKPPTFYSYNECPFAMRARLALIISNIQCELREVNLKQKPDALRVLSEKATVPVLELHNGVVIDESFDVMRYALGVNDPSGWLSCRDITAWVKKVDDSFLEAYRRYKTPEAYPGESWQTGFEMFLISTETLLYKNDGYLDECQFFTLRDAVILPLVYRLSLLDTDWWQALPLPKTKMWLSQFTSSYLFKESMRQRPVWKEIEGQEEWLLSS